MPSLQPSDALEDPRATLADLVEVIHRYFGSRLLGLYLFGSLAVGGFYPGRSDLDLLAILDEEVANAEIDALRDLHSTFESGRPEWRDRIEVAYVSRTVLASFAAAPVGSIARISPGEPMHVRDLEGDLGWILDWHGVVSAGETLVGPPPLTLGPPVDGQRFRDAVRSQLLDLRELVRRNEVAYVPAQQGYIVATVSRALYSLETGEQTSKENAIAWLAKRSPDDADFAWAAYRAYRADVRGPHERLIQFVDDAIADADRKLSDGALP